MEAEDERIRIELKNSATVFRNCATANGLQTEWRSAIGLPAEVLARESRAADIIILGRDSGTLGIYRSADPGDVLMRAGRPVLVVPAGTTNLAAKHIIVSWKDTREARRASHDALPLLQAADLVSVVEVVDESEVEAARTRVMDVVAFLGRHGITAKAEPCLDSERSIADALILVAEQRGADLIVAGERYPPRPAWKNACLPVADSQEEMPSDIAEMLSLARRSTYAQGAQAFLAKISTNCRFDDNGWSG